ncbi:MAG: CRTAC1 family protein, partial [Cystobacter sp.]
ATARFLFLHGRALWRQGPRADASGLFSREPLQRFGAVGGLGLALVAGYFLVVAPSVERRALPFHMERLEAAHTGLGSTMGDVLTSVDPRVLHVSKWVLSVGDAVATGDFDGDGRLDLFLSHALKSDGDRAALYRNVGDLRFERVAVPALARIAANYTTGGAASGGTFVDFDGDGDQDLIIAVAFGPSRLLRNQLRETGEASFEDITAASGMGDHSVSIAVTMLDYDRDGILDLFVANALTTHLPGYDTPTPFNFFRLPAPAYPDDRRMLRFMHNGWHDADNGGLNALYRGRGDGTFEKVDATRSGLRETRWSLAVSTVDLNQDGWTDLYIANDFGPDEVYLNEQTGHFRRLSGSMFGEVGKDTYKGMNASVADFDRNGWLDVYVSNVHHALQAEGSLLWMVSPGKGGFVPVFSDEATSRGALNERRFGWGAAAGDLDNDGWPDIVQANGHIDDRLDHRIDSGRKDYWYINHKLMQSGPEVHTYADKWGDIRGRTVYPNEARRAYMNLGDEKPGHFVDVAKELGLDDPDNSRGVLLADLDNDGDLDAVITNQHGPASVYRNTLMQGAGRDGAHFVGLSLVGNGRNTSRAAVGTRVVLSYDVGGRFVKQVQEVGLMGGLGASADPRLHFGLGSHAGPVTAAIYWYGGRMQIVNLDAGRYHVIVQPPSTADARDTH